MEITTEDWKEYRENATKYLEMNSQYATRKAVQIAIDKQIPQKPKVVGSDFSYTVCPECLTRILTNYCPECGQKIEWDVEQSEEIPDGKY